MPIKFRCPVCKSAIKAPTKRAGEKVPCPKCGQRLQIPPPRRSQTILAPLREDSVQVSAGVPAQATPLPCPVSDTLSFSFESTAGPSLPGKRPKRWKRNLVALAACILLGIFAWIVGMKFLQTGAIGTFPFVQGKTWSNKDMIEHLKKSGLKFEAIVFDSAQIPLKEVPLDQRHLLVFDTFVLLYPPREDGKKMDFLSILWLGLIPTKGVAFFGRHKSAEKLKEVSDRALNDLMINPESHFTWGLFEFSGDPVVIAQIKKAF